MSPRDFRSPWQRPGLAPIVALVRRLLRPCGNLEERFIGRLVEIQNRRVTDHLRRHPPQSALLILPRCVKKTGCRVDVQASLDECLACRECPVGEAAAVCAGRGVTPLVAFRSHIAFAMAREHEPDVIIATACHDRLVKALRSVPEYPALLAPLTGMERMCINATIDLAWLDAQVAAVAPRRATAAAGESGADEAAGP